MPSHRVPQSGSRRRTRGASLVEALVSVLVMAFGMMAVAGIQGRIRYSGDHAKQRAEAVQLAQSEMETLRGFVAQTRSPGLPADAVVFDEIASAERTVAGSNTDFTLTRVVAPLTGGGLDIQITVAWTDRQSESNEQHRMDWRTALASSDPQLAASAFTPPEFGVGQRRALDRHPGIPMSAKKTGTDHSVLKPSLNGTTAWVFNNRTGMVTGRCTVGSSTRTVTLTEDDIAACANSLSTAAYMVTGEVLFSLSSPPDAANPADAVPDSFDMDVDLDYRIADDAPSPRCDVDTSVKASMGLPGADYYCVIPPRSSSALYWSGRIEVDDLRIREGGYRICRYSDDYNGNGRIDNLEHPAAYVEVKESLPRQNFLVVRYSQSCPAGERVDVAAQRYRNTVTVQHQPS